MATGPTRRVAGGRLIGRRPQEDFWTHRWAGVDLAHMRIDCCRWGPA